MDIIEKAGEGSRGGKVIGHTSTGKAIYDSKDSHITSGIHHAFSAKDHKEAANMHTDAKMKDFHSNWQKLKGNPLNKSEVAMNIEKEIEAMAEKMEKSAAGEGSRGGKVIGHTKSGKAIYESGNKGAKGWSTEDHAEASKAHLEEKHKHYETLVNENEKHGSGDHHYVADPIGYHAKRDAVNNAHMHYDYHDTKSKKVKKSEEEDMQEKEALLSVVHELGSEGIKKAMPTLSEAQQELLKSVLAEEVQKSMKLDDKVLSGTQVQGKLTDTKIQEEVANDDADEKIASAAEPEVNHQGGEKQEGWEGQVIKSEEVNMNMQEVIKSMTEEQKTELETKLIAKGMDPKKVAEMMDKKIDASEKKDEKEDKKMIKEEVAEVEKKEEPKMEKSFSWEDPSRLLKANTLGRNHHFSVNDFYDEALNKSKEAPVEELVKSEKETINDILEKGMDCSALDVKAEKLMKDEKKKMNGKIQKSFEDVDMAEALGMSKEEAAKILGEV